MNKVIILHRQDLYDLVCDLKIEMLSVEHFKLGIGPFNEADFIAFEDDATGLLKIFKNSQGPCVTIPYVSLLMAIQMVTKQEAERAKFPKDAQEEVYFKPDNTIPLPRDYVSFDKIGIMAQNGNRAYHPITQELLDTPGPRFIVGFDPASKDQFDPKIGMYMKRLDDPNGPFIQMTNHDSNLPFKEEAMKTAQYYGHQLLEDYNDEINSSVATAIEMDLPTTNKFPETLSEAILHFDHYFNELPLLAFQKMEITFTLKLKISNPEIYTRIKKECGFWCQDTALYKNLSTIYKCDHEECLINTILKAIYRYKNAGRDISGDFKDVLNSYKP